MPVEDYLILVQNVLFALAFGSSALILCRKKKQPEPALRTSNEMLMVQSAIKPPTTEVTTSVMGAPKEEKKVVEEVKKEEKPEPEKEPEKKEEAKKTDQSMKPYPKVKPATESTKKKKEAESAEDKMRKIKMGFYQHDSNNDDTLEKIDSLNVEQSDRTKKNKKKKK